MQHWYILQLAKLDFRMSIIATVRIFIFDVTGKTASHCCHLSATCCDLFAIKLAVERKKIHVTGVNSCLSSGRQLYGFLVLYPPGCAGIDTLCWAEDLFIYWERCWVVAFCVFFIIEGAAETHAFVLKTTWHLLCHSLIGWFCPGWFILLRRKEKNCADIWWLKWELACPVKVWSVTPLYQDGSPTFWIQKEILIWIAK